MYITFFDAPEMVPPHAVWVGRAFAVLADGDWHNHSEVAKVMIATGLKESTVRVALAQARHRKIT